MTFAGRSSGGCDGGIADSVAVQIGGDGRSIYGAGRIGALGEYLRAMRVALLIDHELPAPGSAEEYPPSVHSLPPILMLAGGGRTLE